MHVVTRFAPSPTGYLHIGGARTALYSYLWAKKHNGTFLLRLEDTDQARYHADAEASIYEGLKWLGLDWEGEVVKQSSRTAVYQEYAKRLIDDHKAYYCFCTPDELEVMREIQRKKGRAPRYDKRCSRLTPEEVEQKMSGDTKHVVRLFIPEAGEVTVRDLVRGNITFQLTELDDQVLLKSDGFPTYHLANVIDDHESKVTHVIRGEEWIPSTPKHIMLYRAFGWDEPTFAHLSLFMNKGGGKLSKRDGAQSLLTYRDEGYLQEAVINFMALLGWNPKTEQEMFTIEELIAAFDLTQINTANPVFDTVKLDWFNTQYIKKLSLTELVELCKPYFVSAGISIDNETLFTNVIALERERMKKLSDIVDQTRYFFSDALEYDLSTFNWKANTTEQTLEYLTAVRAELETAETWEVEPLQAHIIAWISGKEWGNGDVLWPLRYALTGAEKSPSPFEVAVTLTKDVALKRIDAAINAIQSN